MAEQNKFKNGASYGFQKNKHFFSLTTALFRSITTILTGSKM